MNTTTHAIGTPMPHTIHPQHRLDRDKQAQAERPVDLVDQSQHRRITDALRQQIDPQKFAMWFDGSARFELDNTTHTLRVTLANQFSLNWVERHYTADLIAAAQKVDHQVARVDLRIATTAAPSPTSNPQYDPAPNARKIALLPTGDSDADADPDAARDSYPSPQTQDQDPFARSRRSGSGTPSNSTGPAQQRRSLNPYKHRLNQFITGPSNQLAFAAAQRAADLNDPTANHPLYLHGGCGLGKTHLLQGICDLAKRYKPDAKILYLTAEQFTNDFIAAVRSNKLETFRRKIRRLDLLAIDDVHFFACKEKTQIEFLCCFEENDLAGSRVVLASDTHPKRISRFSDALISRCLRGMVVEMQEPDPQTRQAVLTELARRRSLVLQPAVLELLGQRYDGSVRELEGVLAQLHALASLQRHRPAAASRSLPTHHTAPLVIGRELIEQLPDFRAPIVRKPVRFNTIAKAVCDRLTVEPKQLAGNSRHKALVLARSLAAYLAREMTTMSYPEIAHAMGRKNHSTIITADHRLRRQIQDNQPIMLPAGAGSTTPRELAQSLTREILHAA